jgi:hypothetical protein
MKRRDSSDPSANLARAPVTPQPALLPLAGSSLREAHALAEEAANWTPPAASVAPEVSIRPPLPRLHLPVRLATLIRVE